jgi:ketosteroid isomerase-like protein
MTIRSTPQSALEMLLRAFARLDLDAMLACFDAQATAFLPVEHHQTRLDGREAIGTAFAAVIARVRARGATSLQLNPADLQVDEWGDTAIASFHLHSEHLSRRTFVLRRFGEQWRIVHLHASNAPLDR